MYKKKIINVFVYLWQPKPTRVVSTWHPSSPYPCLRPQLMQMSNILFFFSVLLASALPISSTAQESPHTPFTTRLVAVGEAYSSTSVNTVSFRKNAVATHGDIQYTAYYDPKGFLTLARRHINEEKWEIHHTKHKGRVRDAHNAISIIIDGEGFLHVALNQHNNSLNYYRSISPDTLVLGKKQTMIGRNEHHVTYPEFYLLPSGNLLFIYREGKSGKGNVVVNTYDTSSKRWQRLHDTLIDGEGQCNAYWQACIDTHATIHLSWVWRDTPAVETNHDLCYARSRDGGQTWEKSDGTTYQLPILRANAEYAFHIPQGSELINQTSMSATADGQPLIATYWRDTNSDVPQYRLVWHDHQGWQQSQISRRQSPFSLSGKGTKQIPIARPCVVATAEKGALVIVRDEELQNRASLFYTHDITNHPWQLAVLTDSSVDAWEPSFDTLLWNDRHLLHLFLLKTQQGDGEHTVATPPQPVYILEINE